MSPAPVGKLRAFDHFTAIVGKGREDAGTQPLMESANMRIRTYNMQDEQFAFHRALRSEEVRIQFRATRSISPSSKTSKFLPARSPSSRWAFSTA